MYRSGINSPAYNNFETQIKRRHTVKRKFDGTAYTFRLSEIMNFE